MHIFVSKLPQKNKNKNPSQKGSGSKNNTKKEIKDKRIKKFCESFGKKNKNNKPKKKGFCKNRYIVSMTKGDDMSIQKGFPTRVEATECGFNFQLENIDAVYVVHKRGFFRNQNKD